MSEAESHRYFYLYEAISALKELGVEAVEARISGTDDSGALEYMHAYGPHGESVSLPRDIEKFLSGYFYDFLIDELDGYFDYPGGYGELLLDLKQGVIEASFAFYTEEREVETEFFELTEVAERIGWKGPIPILYEENEGFTWDGCEWYPPPRAKEERDFLKGLLSFIEREMEEMGTEARRVEIVGKWVEVEYLNEPQLEVDEVRETSVSLDEIIKDEFMRELGG